MKKIHQLFVGLALAAAATLATRASAAQISDILSQTSGSTATADNASGQFPVVTAILSAPGSVNGKTYSSYSFLVNDGTGSADVFGTSLPNGYTPTVGDALSVVGTYSPYHQIPEIGTVTTLTVESTGNVVPAPLIETIPNVNLATLPENIAGQLITVKNVSISGISGTFGVANLTGTITDGASNSMVLYYWPTSYSMANADLFGQTIPTGPVDLTGFVSVYTSGTHQHAGIFADLDQFRPRTRFTGPVGSRRHRPLGSPA